MTQAKGPGNASKPARSLSGGVSRPRSPFDAVTSASKQEAHREEAPRQVRQRRPAFHGRFDRNEEPQAPPDLSPAELPPDDGSRLRREDHVLANGLRRRIEDEPSSRQVPNPAEQVTRPGRRAQHAAAFRIRRE